MSATASALLSELEDLRKVLDSRSPIRSPSRAAGGSPVSRSLGDKVAQTPASMAFSAPGSASKRPLTTGGTYAASTYSPSRLTAGMELASYTSALHDAETNVDRLSKAMEAAEEEMEHTFKRTTDLHRATADRREQEILELRKVLAAKERSIDSLRETLTTTKRQLESRCITAETNLAAREHDCERLLQEVKLLKQEAAAAKGDAAALMSAKASLEHQIDQEVLSNRSHLEGLVKTEAHLRDREMQLEATVRKLTTENNTLRSERQLLLSKGDAMQEEAQLLRRELSVCAEKCKGEQDMRAELTRRIEVERKKRKEVKKQKEDLMRHKDAGAETRLKILELERQLKDERKSRLGAEKWLQAELKTKEEMENMFCSLRDVAITKQKEEEIHNIKQAVVEMQQSQAENQRETLLKAQKEEFDKLQTSLERENQRLKEDLRSAQRDIGLAEQGGARGRGAARRAGSLRLYGQPAVDREPNGDLFARCRRCHDRFNLSKPPCNECGYHPGDLTPSGYTCCGVVPRPGSTPVYCHWRPHVA